ncbi:MAG: amylo-alpha-1,6-glucosidase [bacterium]|nr:amylo-alpha-1,6-glucosidase [bacterium]
MTKEELWTLGLDTIRELETERGILASGEEEIYGCIFGRDSLITSLKLLKTYEKTGDTYFLSLVKKILINLAKLQGQVSNIESGEELGKIIHEYRENNHEHLTGRADKPWYLYSDDTMRNYDSVDSTSLFLIAVSKYVNISADKEFASEIEPYVELSLEWLCSCLEADERGFVSYQFHPDRKFGGLVTQSWMDSYESIFHEDGTLTPYPIAPAEVQAYAYCALRLWGLDHEADKLKERFNKYFVINEGEFIIAFALDGKGFPMKSLRSSIGHILWASLNKDSILDSVYIPKLVGLLLSPDLFEPNAGVRTLSKLSSHYDPMSYHNGSIWPHDSAIIAEGLNNFGYFNEAEMVRKALTQSWGHFKTPIELFVFKEGQFSEYLSSAGQKACLKQAWSAASILSEL